MLARYWSGGTVAAMTLIAARPGPVPGGHDHSEIFTPAPAQPRADTSGARISGVVTLAGTGTPVAGVTVRARPAGGFSSSDHPSGVSAADGSFTIAGIPPGDHEVSADEPGLYGVNRGPFAVGATSATTGVSVVVRSAHRVVGHVVLRETGEPCAKGHVVFSQSDVARLAEARLMATIARAGTVTLEGVPDGRYSVFVNCTGHVSAGGPKALIVGEGEVTGLLWKVSSEPRYPLGEAGSVATL
jgi:hypothetical protein